MRKFAPALVATLILFPASASAQTVQMLILDFTSFLNAVIVPLIIAIAFLFFLINMVRYFLIEAANEAGREKAKRLAVYGIIAFVLMISLWGIVNVLLRDFGWTRTQYVCPDFMPGCQSTGTTGGNTSAFAPSFSSPNSSPQLPSPPWNSSATNLGTNQSDSNTTPATHEDIFLLPRPPSSPEEAILMPLASNVSSESILIGSGAEDTLSNGFDQGEKVLKLSPPEQQCSEFIIDPQSRATTDARERAYVMIKDQNGKYRIADITQRSNEYLFEVDEVAVGEAFQIGQDVHVIHTHPKSTIDKATLGGDKLGPSAADINFLCRYHQSTHVVVEPTTTYRYKIEDPSRGCPLSSEASLDWSLAEAARTISAIHPEKRPSFFSKLYEELTSAPNFTEDHKDKVRQKITALEAMNTEQLRTQYLDTFSRYGIVLEELPTAAAICDGKN